MIKVDSLKEQMFKEKVMDNLTKKMYCKIIEVSKDTVIEPEDFAFIITMIQASRIQYGLTPVSTKED